MSEDLALYLHCGYHKTGSSYLQSVLAANCDYLQKHGIFYPVHGSDDRASRGEPTAGNGHEFALALRALDEAQVTAMLQQAIDSANSTHANKLLLSAEGFFHTFGLVPDSLSLLNDACRRAGIETIKLLVIVRHPAEHALSVYRHRGKGTYLGSPEQWLLQGYETLDLMKSFLTRLDHNPGMECSFRRYDRQTILTDLLFDQWLDIPAPSFKSDGRVRESLRLSEVLVIQAMEEHIPGCGLDITLALQELTPANRVKDDELLKNVTQRIACGLEKWKVLIERMDALLPEYERMGAELSRDWDQSGNLPEDDQTIRLSVQQLQAISSALAGHFSAYSRIKRRIRRLLPSVLVRWIRPGR
jgi:hypothetical protein